jgi:glutathione S-transferase
VDTDPQTGERRSALVVWVDDKMDYATLYTPEWIYKFQRETGEERFLNYDRDGRYYDRAVLGGWSPRMVNGELAQPEVNPLGVVPVVELRNQTLLDDSPISDIQGVMAMQDSINLVWAYLLNALDSASLPQRVVTGADVPQVPILDSNGQQIGTRPVELDKLHGEAILWLPDDAAKIAEWSVAQLDAFGSVIERGVEHIAAQTRTPPHYLVAKMVNTAAESLTIAEAGLVSKTRERIRYVNPAIREVNRLVALCQGADERRIGAIASGQNLWGDVQYRSEAQMADAMLKMKQVGFPFEYIAERYGLQPDDIQRVLEMRKAELASDPLAAAQAAMQMPVNGNG